MTDDVGPVVPRFLLGVVPGDVRTRVDVAAALIVLGSSSRSCNCPDEPGPDRQPELIDEVRTGR